ncbi:MAG: V-type ATP synthase subunit E family protein [Clostridiaceae bacterium]|nr:V-type ATP synthase subunit E family protein [Clostridiaceae bacterium]
MNGLEAIQDRILAEAREKANEILNHARQSAAETLASARQCNEAQLAETRQKASAQAEAIKSRARSMAAMEKRKALLQARRDLVDQAVDIAAVQLRQLDTDKKIAFYRQLLLRAKMQTGELVLSAADFNLGERIIADYSGSIHLAAAPGAFEGGLIIRQELIEENLTLDLIIKNRRSQLVRLAASVLFPAESSAGSGKVYD